MNPLRHRFALVVLCLALSTCRTAREPLPAGAEAGPEKGPIHLTLVGTNDLHGWVHPRTAQLPSGSQVVQGGVGWFAGHVNALRAHNPGGVLLLDAGDLFQGTLAANLTEGEVVIDAYNRIGYDAAAVGNHEFDYGPVGPVSVALDPNDDPFGALKARIRQAKFPLLAVNVYQQDGQRPAWLGNDGTVLLERKGLRVGVFGLVTPQTPTTTNPVNVSTLRFGSLAPEAAAAAKKLREQGADLVVAVVHAGGKCDSWDNPNDLSTCRMNGEVFEMLEGLEAGAVDAVIAGHTHAAVGHFVRGTPVIESFGLGRYYGTIDLYVDPVRRTVLKDRTEIRAALPICAQVDSASGGCDVARLKETPATTWTPAKVRGTPVVEDAAVAAVVEPVLSRVETEQKRPLGVQVPKAMGRDYEQESPLGSFLADSLRTMEKADVALINSGGLRADLPAGPLTYGAVYEIMPFDNTIATVSLTGEELRRLLQAAYGAHKGVFQVSGVQVELSSCLGRDRLRSFTFADGTPWAPTKRYRVVMADFLARGGDGLGAVISALPSDRVDFGSARPLNYREALIAHWKAAGKPLRAPALGRIRFAKDAGRCAGQDRPTARAHP